MEVIDVIFVVYSKFRFGWGCVAAVLCFGVYMVCAIQERQRLGLPITGKVYFKGIIFTVYMVLLLGGTLLNRTRGVEYGIELCPFWSYWEAFTQHNHSLWQQIFFNVAVFIPWGFLFPFLFHRMKNLRWNVLGAAMMSLVIEILQLIFKCGLFEFDDLFHNTLGTLIGYGIWKVLCKRSVVEKLDG